ncbi:outer membrane protein assembly factor BamA [Sphingomonas radiodurans]|uniref:outer membrane protein assembly factor BamA n=1 Tax=Sphingomonas radiodurans TaxID=2890321 RepID=UPI001E453503|nr:outer membrane protein assembly factor BamA [Sphingomonas radiodurans]WBH18281.1 outer membrane protein assembly factor BamA [Sphingomonas radiodurans]
MSLGCTILAVTPVVAAAQNRLAPPGPGTERAPVAPAVERQIKSLRVEGSQRIEAETALSYTKLRIGQTYTNETLDQAIKDLYASDLFADVTVSGAESGDIVLRVRENPIINRVILEGNKRLKEDKITKEIRLKPRQVFTRTAVRQDVARIVELYRRQGRFGASVAPKMVALDQNRVDVVFEISEGPKSKVRQINIIGNEVFDDDKLREQMATKQARLFRLLSSNTTYDQDRLAYDQQKLRQFYLTEGYADFRVTSAVAELTPDKEDFIITYVVEEGARYKFGDVTVDSDIRDFDDKALAKTLVPKKGDWYNAKLIEDTIDSLSQTTGLFGYAFTQIEPEIQRDKEALTMSINFHIAEAKRSYIERVDITGNTQTQDKVIRREIRLAEGDAFNSFQVKRSQDRINSLGYFQEKFEIKQTPGSTPDRVVLGANVEERATGELQLSAGYSSQENALLQASITQRNFRGKGQELRLSGNYSASSKSVELGFTEPYLFDRNIAVGVDVFRRDYRSFSSSDNNNTTYEQVSTGLQLRAGIPLTEFWQFASRYTLSYEQVSLDEATYYTNGACDSALAGQYLCDAVGNRWTSSIGYSLIYDSLNSRIRPTSGNRLTFSQDFAGLGGDVRYLRTRAEASKYWNVGSGFVLSAQLEGGHIFGIGQDVQLTDRFYLGDPQMRGFDIRGVGPRVTRTIYDTSVTPATLSTDSANITQDALGGTTYYRSRLELELPLGTGARELGLRPSIYMDVGAVFGGTSPRLTDTCAAANAAGSACTAPLRQYTNDDGALLYLDADGNATTTNTGTPYNYSLSAYKEIYQGNSASPRLSVGIGVNWTSPFGPLRIDLAKALLSQPGDDTKLITFSVGGQF